MPNIRCRCISSPNAPVAGASNQSDSNFQSVEVELAAERKETSVTVHLRLGSPLSKPDNFIKLTNHALEQELRALPIKPADNNGRLDEFDFRRAAAIARCPKTNLQHINLRATLPCAVGSHALRRRRR